MNRTEAAAARPASADDGTPGDERILRATMRVLTEMDPTALTIHRICDEANVSPPTLYYHFGSKDGLVAAAVERLVSDWLAVLDARVSREGPLDDTLGQALEGWEAMIREPSRPLAVFVWVTLLTAGKSQQSRDALIRARDRSHDMVRQALIPHMADAGESDRVSALLLDAVIAAALEFQLDGDEAGMRRRLDTLAHFVRMAAGPGDAGT